jgi:CxxC-x17-CxxC domain-containing protein
MFIKDPPNPIMMSEFEPYEEGGRYGKKKPGRFRDRGSSRDRDSGGFRDRSSSFSGKSRDPSHTFGAGRFKKFKAVCSKCGDECELPFVPTNHKPVFCSKCYRKVEYEQKNGGSSESGASPGRLDEINRKLDRILKLLHDDVE